MNQIFLATWVAKQKNKKTFEKVTFFAVEEPADAFTSASTKKTIQLFIRKL